MTDSLKQLERRVDQLIDLCHQLRKENETLRSARDGLIKEQSRVSERNRLARDRLESIVDRLRTLEEAS